MLRASEEEEAEADPSEEEDAKEGEEGGEEEAEVIEEDPNAELKAEVAVRSTTTPASKHREATT